jgi:hypothetical protein
MVDDAELTRRILAGDREAAGVIYDRYAPLVRAVLLDATGSRRAEDRIGLDAVAQSRADDSRSTRLQRQRRPPSR